ncbi:MAG: DUF2911 domain-containing protein [Saprospiraceae bacterium]|nr:DUF2911 domain-containing protein [Saprospiraceae bacterium]
MRSTLILFLLALMTTFAACGGGASTTEAESETDQKESTTDETTNQEEESMAETTTATGEAYTVLKDGIPSPRVQFQDQVNGVDFTLVYGSPSVKEREIWGGLVPYGQVWRTGANEATTIEFANDVKVEGQNLPAGKYAIFTINEADKTTVVFNKVHEQWGAYDYDEAEDALRVEVMPKSLEEAVEQMDFVVEGDMLMLRWADRGIPMKIEAA